MFEKPKGAVYTEHLNLLGGGTMHCFRFIEYLKEYYDLDVLTSEQLQSEEFMKRMMKLDITGITARPYTEGDERKYGDFFMNVSHWRIKNSVARKKFAIVFFPQNVLDPMDYTLLANSEYTKKNIIEKWHAKPEQVEVVYPPITTKDFKPASSKVNSIVHVSRFASPVTAADKGHRQMIEAFKSLKPEGWSLNMVGQVQDQQYYNTLEGSAKGTNIRFHKSIEFAELQKLYSLAKIYWHMTGIAMPQHPGAQEHFGMTTVEAMSAGCVPVTLATGGQPEIVTDGKDGFLVQSVSELIEKTDLLIKDEKLREKMSKAAMERAKDFDEESSKTKLYKTVLGLDKVTVVMVTWDGLAKTKTAIQSLYQHHPDIFQLVVVDNASTDGTVEWLKAEEKKHKNMQIIYNKENKGFSAANNQGLKKAKGEYIIYLNNDTETKNMWMHRMVQTFDTHKSTAIIGARLYFPSQDGTNYKIQHAGVDFKWAERTNCYETTHIGRFAPSESVPGKGLERVKAITGACMGIRKEFAEFSEKYERGYYEDTDLCLWVQAEGYEVYIDHNIELIHDEGSSQRRVEEAIRGAYLKKNKARFHKKWDDFMKSYFKKWQAEPDLRKPRKDTENEFKNIQRDVLERVSFKSEELPAVVATEHMLRYLFAANRIQGKDVLDIACGTGYGMQYMSRWAKSVTGFDYSQEAITEAKNGKYYCPAHLEKKNLEKDVNWSGDLAEKYDVVTCFETVEHLTNTDQLFKAILQSLKPGGELMFSVPNSPDLIDRNPWHKAAFNIESILNIVQDHRLQDVKIYGQNQYGLFPKDDGKPYFLVYAKAP